MKEKPSFVLVLMWLLIIATISLGVYVLVAYGSKPITEIPSWAVWFFVGRGRVK